MKIIDEIHQDVLARVATIMGPQSAAARALAEAAQHDGPVRFFRTDRGSILLEKSPKERANEESGR